MVETAVLVAVIIGMSEMIKRISGNRITKFIPLINLALGIVGALFYSGLDVRMGVFEGIIVGLTASGLYSGAKNVKQGITKNGEDQNV